MAYIGQTPTRVPLTSSDITDGSISNADISDLAASKLTGALPAISGAALTNLPATTLDSPVITGTLSVLPSGTVTHTISNWSDDLSWTITPTNCTAGAVNGSGEFVITHTSGTPSYTILATTASLGVADSALVTKNITFTLTAPTLSSPADVGTAADVVYTITSTDSNDDKLILDPGTANFTYQSESGPGTASKVGNTVECVGFGTGNPVVTIQFTAEATYSVTAKAVKIDGTYGTSANSSADSITIANYVGMVATSTGSTNSAGVTVATNYKVHTFNTSGTFAFTVSTVGDDPELECLVVAGGGAGSGWAGGGGGGGGYRNSFSTEASGGGNTSGETPKTATAVAYVVVVGAGGASNPSLQLGSNGTASSISHASITNITTVGGGGGSYYGNPTGPAGSSGGSGGGSGGSESTGSQGAGGAGTANEGYAGGVGHGDAAHYGGGGGGGAAAIGVTTGNDNGGAGGAGLNSDISGSTVGRAGGGGGSAWSGFAIGTASHGGGAGGLHTTSNGVAGTANTGGGGGGFSSTSSYSNAGAGGSGVVLIRYKFQ